VDVPDRLRALRSPNRSTREDGRTRLFALVTHEGSRWSVSAVLVPFLVALVDDVETADREDVVGLLHAVALGDVSLPFEVDFSAGDALSADDMAAAALPDAPEELTEAAALRWAAEAYRAAAAHVDSYVRWLADPLVAAQAAELLAYFPPTQDMVDGLVASAAPASANLTLAHVTGYPKVDAQLAAALDSTAVDVRMTAAVALAFRLGPNLPAEALDVLVDVKPPPAPPGWDRSMRGFVTLALRKVGL
jgi:hypothetical protein